MSEQSDRVLSEETLQRLERLLEDEGPVIIERRFHRGSRSPEWHVVDSTEALRAIVATARQGDPLFFWSFVRCCTDERIAARGVVPDANGKIPATSIT